jgi:hypothetical protein
VIAVIVAVAAVIAAAITGKQTRTEDSEAARRNIFFLSAASFLVFHNDREPATCSDLREARFGFRQPALDRSSFIPHPSLRHSFD